MTHSRRPLVLGGTLFLLLFYLCAFTLLNGGGKAYAQTFSATKSGDDMFAAPAPASKRIVGYFTAWSIYGRNYNLHNVDVNGQASKLTTINYAFSNVSSDLKCQLGDSWADTDRPFAATEAVNGQADSWSDPLRGNFNQLKELKALHPGLQTMISIGGWSWSALFSDAALPQNRAAFVQSCIDLYIKGNLPSANGAGAGVFDGIDIDWEYPAAPGNTGNVYRPEDTQNFTALLAEFRHQLDALSKQTGKRYLLSAALPAGPDKYQKIELNKIGHYLNWANLMTYDLHGAWDAQGPTDFAAPLYSSHKDPSPAPTNAYSVDNTVRAYLRAGFEEEKLVVGIPFYGHGWTNVPNQNHGLYQSSPDMQPAPGVYEAGTNDYNVLAQLNYPKYRDPITKASWIFDGTTFWSFDDATAVATKVHYVKSHDLAGAMFWSLDGDDSSATLTTTVYNGFHSDSDD